jgi:hypothetical protein
MAEISPLRHRMIEDMTVCNLSPATQLASHLLSTAWLATSTGCTSGAFHRDCQRIWASERDDAGLAAFIRNSRNFVRNLRNTILQCQRCSQFYPRPPLLC